MSKSFIASIIVFRDIAPMTISEAQAFFTLRLTPSQIQRLAAGEAITVTVVLDSSGVMQADMTAQIHSALRAQGLSPRQTQLVLLDWQGYTRAEIVQRLELSPRTVDWHWRTINERLGVANRAALRALVRRIVAASTESGTMMAGEPLP